MNDKEIIHWWTNVSREDKAKIISPHIEMFTRAPAKGFKASWEHLSEEEWNNYIQLCEVARRKNKIVKGIK